MYCTLSVKEKEKSRMTPSRCGGTIMPAVGKLRQENHKFEANPSCKVGVYLNKTTNGVVADW